MATFYVQYLAVYGNEKLPNNTKIIRNNRLSSLDIAKDFKMFAKVSEFSPIWSHWWQSKISLLCIFQLDFPPFRHVSVVDAMLALLTQCCSLPTTPADARNV